MTDASHHGTRLPHSVIEKLHEPMTTIYGIIGPIKNELGTKMIVWWKSRVRMLWNDNIWERAASRIVANTTRLLDVWEHVVWVVQMKDGSKFRDVKCNTQDGGGDDQAYGRCPECLQYGIDFILGHMAVAKWDLKPFRSGLSILARSSCSLY